MSSPTVLLLCQCCAVKLANDDESGCRDFHHHDHPGLDVPVDTVIVQGPHPNDGTLDLTCHGHEGGVIHSGGEYWVAEVLSGRITPPS